MKAVEFKTELKKIQELLRGLTFQFITANSVRPINSLREFGLKILEQEKYGNDFKINMAWTANEGTLSINSFEQLVALLKTKKLTCVTIEAYYQPADFTESLRYGFTLND
jgi:hypothetical protein